MKSGKPSLKRSTNINVMFAGVGYCETKGGTYDSFFFIVGRRPIQSRLEKMKKNS